MFDISPEKIVIVLIIALVVLGPGRLSDSARALGRARAQLRAWTAALPPDTANLVRNPRGALLDVLAEPRQVMADTAEAARQSVTPTTEPGHETALEHEGAER
ncbi:MAG: twin-arginine translocase TatA/TatE family subunit [Acidimicrobiaceae bacterium]|nr:twin-arginine translocase TatA/TatE family subunit [Acidimicrobiaceae bacterium]